ELEQQLEQESAALSACCYVELASRCPSAGSAYHYAYICLGEGIAWLVGWELVLDYKIGGLAIARGISPNLASFFGGSDKLHVFLARQTIPGLGIVVDPCAALLVIIFTILLCFGIMESSLVQAIVASVNVCTLMFIIVVGGYLAFKTGWAGYDLPDGTAEELQKRMFSPIIVGLVPYYTLDPDTPISSTFGDSGMQWAVHESSWQWLRMDFCQSFVLTMNMSIFWFFLFCS
ncbi:unnamed protein product, partial [Eruca vesicaria subsp. sativa]|nr:unnamed protein product [Eruca vesicaria subsp. sativa]